MFFLRLVMTAVRSLESHFLRTLLATLGVLIGVGSVVACMSILEGASNSILDRFKSLGSNLIFIQPAEARIQGRSVGRAQSLTLSDVDAIANELGDDVSAVAPQAIGGATVKHFQKSGNFTLIATSDKYFTMNDFKAAAGRAISPSESQDEVASVVCIGSEVARKLFGGMDPLGRAIKINNASYRVIGVMEARGNIGFLDVDNSVFIPIRFGLKRFFNQRHLSWIAVQASPEADIDQLKAAIQKLLRREHRIRVGQEDDFEVQTLEETIQQFGQAAMIFKVVFYSIAGISLLVGGIGIMNIMLVSVTERTREIGVRMAVGAKRGDILVQFLVEALIISLLGGGLGCLLGMMFADLIDKVLMGMLKTEITFMVIAAALATTTFVGVVSGIYPAYKASRLDPVEALRYE